MNKIRVEILLKAIELLKAELDQLIGETKDLLDPNIINKSQELDKLLVEYYELLKELKE
ncbi:Spo0E family sporulation regulatory protein-aspartic acid phosphatase [Caldicellulosiruptoraceae bacterium PP1]